jgi:hypothetical protein
MEGWPDVSGFGGRMRRNVHSAMIRNFVGTITVKHAADGQAVQSEVNITDPAVIESVKNLLSHIIKKPDDEGK